LALQQRELDAPRYSITLCELFHKAPALSDPAVGSTRALLAELYSAATAAAAPGPALRARLEKLKLEPARPIWIIALGKAAHPMAQAAVEVLEARGLTPAGGLIVAPVQGSAPHPRIESVAGDHPEPGAGSLAAAEALAATAARVQPSDEVWVLLSGGTTSLVGAPEAGIQPAELTAIYSLLLGSGLDITAMNRIRKRFSRWGGGKLARALAPALVRAYLVSDVIGDDLASIGSGPCAPDPTTARDIHALLEGAQLWSKLPESARQVLLATESGKMAETPKPGDQAFARVSLELVASNRLALEAAAKRAAELGLAPSIIETPLAGEAAAAGASVAASLLNNCVRPPFSQPTRRGDTPSGTGRPCFIWGGETTVTLGAAAGLGGRCQELALTAARLLEGAPVGTALLAAGTDGRDGPTDAAGAIVDGSTWWEVMNRGRNPARDLDAHNAYRALDAAGALLRPGLTGTNVMDLVIGVCPPP
jgi:hydroxypyruvate reductase